VSACPASDARPSWYRTRAWVLEVRNMAGEMATWDPQSSSAEECSLTLVADACVGVVGASVLNCAPADCPSRSSSGEMSSSSSCSITSTVSVSGGEPSGVRRSV